jgi:PD-(D/E)XK nuclease superfamily
VYTGTKRLAPYVWASWASKLLAGTVHCRWAYWYRAHYRDFARRSDADFESWAINHARLVDVCARDMERLGYTAYVENQNHFTIRNKNGLAFAGQPDIVAVKGEEAIVIDCKTGKLRDFHDCQVMLYMLCLPHVDKPYSNFQLSGRLVYPDDWIDLPSWRLTDTFRADFREMMRMLGSDEEPRRSPGPFECRFCDITEQDCPDRDNSGSATPVETNDLF